MREGRSGSWIYRLGMAKGVLWTLAWMLALARLDMLYPIGSQRVMHEPLLVLGVRGLVKDFGSHHASLT